MTIAPVPDELVLRNPAGYARAAIRTGSAATLELLTRSVTSGEHSLAALVTRLRTGDIPSAWLGSRRRAFACLLTAMSTDGLHADVALAGWLAVQRRQGTEALGEASQLLLAQLALEAGRDDLARRRRPGPTDRW